MKTNTFIQRAMASVQAATKSPFLKKLCYDLCELEDDQVCDLSSPQDIEYYADKKQLVQSLKRLGFKYAGNDARNFIAKDGTKITVVPENAKTTFIRLA